MDRANLKVKALEDEILDDAETELIGMINLDELLMNPKAHLESVASKFMLKHVDKIKEAGRIGRSAAERSIR